MMKTKVSIITVTLFILQTKPDRFRVFKAGSVLPILGSILPFCIHNYAWEHFCLGIIFAAEKAVPIGGDKHKTTPCFELFGHSRNQGVSKK